MSATSKSPKPSLKTSIRRRRRSSSCRARRSFVNGGRKCSEVSDKLEALKSLIPRNSGEIVKPDQLFQETADYIVFLRTQVVILQTLIEVYGSSTNAVEKQENVL